MDFFQEYDLVLGWRSTLLGLIFMHLLITAIVLVKRKIERDANIYLALLLTVIAFDLVPQIIGFAGFYDAFPWLSFAPFSNPAAIGPLLLAYIYAITSGKVPRPIYYALIPSVGIFCYQCYWFTQPLEKKWAWVASHHGSVIAPSINYFALLLALISVSLAYIQVHNYRKWLADQSSASMEFDQRWLPYCLLGLAIPLLAWLFMDIYTFIFGRLSYFEAFPFYVILSFSAYAIASGAMTKTKFSFPKMANDAVKENLSSTELKTDANASLQEDAAALREMIINQKLYLEPRLSLQDLARRMATNETYISKIINQGAECNFNRFVNQIRVECAKQGIKSTGDDILHIALASGFNSKATFNRVFKEITQLTPSQYKRQLSS